ncbi:hypothetical protein [Azoarcus sp. KH32C]|uniref:hypothetical protein n=1 Tax=Azoarcus sp. KH32C TaxID=748247 RepID=UPI0002385F24|nr:hypothetical protein [Azoarcus sp. KH32C]BAL25612.1 hypothetical protein AZKH_3323 [Azoarcus sp. KH32C]
MRKALTLACVAVLVGCTTPAQRAAQIEREVDEMIAVYGPACEKLGYASDSDPWRDCIMRLNARDHFDRYSRMPTTTSCIGHRGFFNCTTF